MRITQHMTISILFRPGHIIFSRQGVNTSLLVLVQLCTVSWNNFYTDFVFGPNISWRNCYESILKIYNKVANSSDCTKKQTKRLLLFFKEYVSKNFCKISSYMLQEIFCNDVKWELDLKQPKFDTYDKQCSGHYSVSHCEGFNNDLNKKITPERYQLII